LSELQRGVYSHFLAVRAAEGFRPLQFARVTLHFEVFVAFGATEAELFGVVADEGYAFRWVAGLGAEVAGFDSVRSSQQ
jgi:hypothetical protein